jgi:hypothetical protein
MFRDMTSNESLPGGSNMPFTWPPASKYDWTIAFILMNVFAAAMYYAWEYRKRH